MKTFILALVASVLLECQATSPVHTKRTSKLRSSTGFRLPGTARPNHYNLTLNFALAGTVPTATGEVVINLDVDNDNDDKLLYLNSGVTFAPNTVATWSNNAERFPCSINASQLEYIILNCTQLIVGANQTVTIPFIPTVSVDTMQGAYVSRFYEDGRRKYIIATQFEQDSARAAFPSFDEPQYKAPITLTLITSTASGYNGSGLISNTEVNSNTTQYGLSITTFDSTPAMSTYLLAFIITEDFKVFSNTSEIHSYSFSVFARKTADGYVNTALKNGPQLVDQIGKFVNLTYDTLGNSKLTLAAIPEFAAGAMENWGLITFRETYLIDEGDRTALKDVQAITSVIAHELAHQWFGDYVTLDWWSDTWLNEGFADFFEYYLTDQVLENAEMLKQLIIKDQQPALKVDAYPNAIPLSSNASDVTTESDFSKEFGTISYSKGSSIIKLIQYTVGDVAFQSGLNTYLKNHRYGNTSPSDLIDAIQSALGNKSTINLTLYFNEWIYEAGYPVLEVSLNSTTNYATIHTKRFSSSLNKTGENDTSIWWIPLTYTTSNKSSFVVNTDTITWLSPEESQNYSIRIEEDAWVLINLQSAGFYRVNYDETLWNRLIAALQTKSFGGIDVLNRAQLLDDVFNIARSYEGDTNQQRAYYLRAFKLANYLVNETEYHPWYTYFVEIQYLLDRIQDKDTLNTLKINVLELLNEQTIAAINATTYTNQTHIQVLKNNLLLNWACKLGHEKCQEWALNEFQEYLNESSRIDNNYRDVILCTGLANSDNIDEHFNLILNRLNDSILPLEQNDLAKALGCVRDKNYTYQAVVETLKENQFSRMMYPTILSSLASDGTEKLIYTLKAVLANDLAINEKWQAVSNTETILNSIAAKCFSNECIETIRKDYVELYKNDTSRASVLDAANKSIDIINTNLDWVNKYEDVLISVIEYGGQDSSTESPPETTTNRASANIAFNVFLGCPMSLFVIISKTLSNTSL